MEPTYEIFNGSGPLDIRIFLHKVNIYPLHWHYAHEFLFILGGQAKITVGEETFLCKENDLIFISALTPHMIFAPEGTVMLALQVNVKIFDGFSRFDVNSAKNSNEDYSQIISVMANLIKLHSEGGPNHEILMQSYLLKLKYEMLCKYKIHEDENENSNFELHFNKLQYILRYIQENYKFDISLNEVAKKFFYSTSYLSRLFEKTMDITFKKYVNNLRLANAVELLISTDKSIEQIANESGFPNTRSFVALHKEMYGTLPSERRKDNSMKVTGHEDNSNYVDFKKTDYLSKLVPYLGEKTTKATQEKLDIDRVKVSVDSEIVESTLKHTFKKFCSVGRASDLLKQNVRNMITTMQNEIGFEYIKFHGLFDDDLSVYVKTSDGRIVINFDAIDSIIDFLLSIRLKPLIQLSFMPKALAKYPEKETFFKPFITSEPRSNAEWTDFIKKFVSHLLSRYGQETVQTWLFCLWNEPESSPKLFGFVDGDLFKDFYIETYKAVKEICPTAKFGCSSLMPQSITDTDYFEKTFLSDKSCIPDFINVHFYPLTNATFNTFNLTSSSVTLSSNPYIMGDTINKIKEKLKSIGLSHLPIYLTEWNSTTSHRDLLNDTAFKGAYVARNIIDNYDKIDSFGYWSLTDDILELPLEDKLFHGGIGLFTKSGIKKPPYYAFQFLGQLGNKLLKKDRGYILTEDIRGFQMVLVNYIHYNDIYAAGELFDASRNNRYAPFRSEKEMNMDIEINHAVTGYYLIEEYIVNRKTGSCYDIWLERFHNEEPTTVSAMEALKQASYPKYCMNRIYVDNGVVRYRCKMEPHEIRLVKIKRL